MRCILYFFFYSFTFCHPLLFLLFFFNDTATTEIYTLSLHDALPISRNDQWRSLLVVLGAVRAWCIGKRHIFSFSRSEEHTSELQSHLNLVCRLLLEKKKKNKLL